MVQILPQPTSLGSSIGQSAGQGLQQGIQKGISQGRLQSAFNNLDPNASYIEQLKSIAPILLTTEGGSQVLGELASTFATNAQNQAVAKSIAERRGILNQQDQGTQADHSNQGLQQNTPGQVKNNGEINKYRNPQAPNSNETLFPQRTAGPQPQPVMSPRQVEDYALNLMQQSLATGKPIPYEKAMNIANNANQQVIANNQLIRQEQKDVQQSQKVLSDSLVKRAQNGGYLKDPEDITVAEKFALEAQNAPSENEAWEYVRTKLKQYDNARTSLQSELGLAGPFTNLYRMLNGSYKDQEEIMKSIQPSLDKYRKLGLYDEAKKDLVDNLGFGNEQAHMALFPMDKKVKHQVSKISANPIPLFRLDANRFGPFKEKLADIIKENPDIDIVGLRGILTENQKYNWHDVYKALDQLVEERRFIPDIEQEKQLSTIRHARAEGLGAYFQYMWSGKL